MIPLSEKTFGNRYKYFLPKTENPKPKTVLSGEVFLEDAVRRFLGKANLKLIMRFPGIVLGVGFHGEGRTFQAAGDIEKIGRKHRGLKQILTLADGGHHKPLPGEAILDFSKYAFGFQQNATWTISYRFRLSVKSNWIIKKLPAGPPAFAR